MHLESVFKAANWRCSGSWLCLSGFHFLPHFLAHSLFSTHSLQDWGLQMITWANVKIVCPFAGLQRERGSTYSISPLSWVPWPIKGPKLQKPGCYHHYSLYQPLLDPRGGLLNTSTIQPLASATMLLQFKVTALWDYCNRAPFLVFLPSC